VVAEEPGPLTPVLHRVVERQTHTEDVTTVSLVPLSAPLQPFRCGQFNMLAALGVGEAAISVSSAPREEGPLRHTVRDVGPVSHALCAARVGDLVGVRGPYGTDWGVDSVDPGEDAVVVAGGIGLAPLRGAIDELVARSSGKRGRIFVLVGARQPQQVIFGDDLARWAGAGAHVEVTVDIGTPGWQGQVGLVTSLLPGAGFDPARTTALMCGPEIMMRFTARDLLSAGVAADRIRVSLERNMQCGVGWCGHCQLGPYLLCRDGPVFSYGGVVSHLLTERER
jgi:NAD(P)H-flavin reductase